MKLSAVLLASGLLVAGAAQASAGTIIAPVAGVVNLGGPGFGSLSDTFNQAGLFTTYVPGVTDFDTYIASNPVHSFLFSGFEWFSNLGSSSAQVTYDFGSIFSIDALALWNEEQAGIGVLSVYGSTDSVTFVPLLLRVLPTDIPNDALNYPAQVFTFGAASARYVRFDMSECPQQPGGFNSCAIGEVAFRSAAASEVPEPATLLLFGGGAMALARLRRRATRETL